MDTTKQKRGLAALSPERRREIASLGGRTAHEQGVAHQWDAESARAAGRRAQELHPISDEERRRRGRAGGLARRGFKKANRDDRA